MSVVTLSQWIGGEPRAPSSGETLEDKNPATDEVIAQIPRGDGRDVQAAVEAARAALAGPWGRTSSGERADLLDRVADAIEARLDAWAELESQDTGKPVSLARAVDIPRAVSNFRFFAGAIRHSAEGFHPMAGAFNYTLRRPGGVVGLITPRNLP
ncbi:MAG TPA: 2-hydroxymuconic semialdehyde dehydrogenase, partial [Planctomycetes bacterium]|nr:2-hydroxymuconic semialdehyde dehydrogenase [Planctomycetota bacterium]